jgi:hypothetical protein
MDSFSNTPRPTRAVWQASRYNQQSLELVHANLSPPTHSNSFAHFLSILPLHATTPYFCYIPQERMVRSVDREWCCHSDVSVRFTIRNQYCYYWHEMQLPTSQLLLLLHPTYKLQLPFHYVRCFFTYARSSESGRRQPQFETEKEEMKIILHFCATFCWDALSLLHTTQRPFNKQHSLHF